MFAITLCKLAWYDKNFVVEVYMTPIEPSRFTGTIPELEFVVGNYALPGINAVPGSVTR